MPSVNERALSKQILEIYDVEVWKAFYWPRIDFKGRLV
jgi:hypothetical protein